MIGVLKGIETIDDVPSSQVRYRMIDNLAGTQKSFTNVQDQEFVVTRRKDNSLLFSIRFVYAAHVTDFAGRCEAVSAWFFQCPEPLDRYVVVRFDSYYFSQQQRQQHRFWFAYSQMQRRETYVRRSM